MLRFELATTADDEALRRILRENPVPGNISVSFEREPSYFLAAAIEGPIHQVVVGRSLETGKIAGMGCRSVRRVYVNGAVQPVGYVSQVRIDAGYRRTLFLARGLAQAFQFFHVLHADRAAPFYLMSIIAGNDPARRLFSSNLPGFPHAREYARLFTYAVYIGRAKRPLPLPGGLRLARGAQKHVAGIVECLQRNGARRQFAPYWSLDSLFNPEVTPDLVPEDFTVALGGQRVVGCIARWDQSRFKQNMVRGYDGPLGRWRRLVNLAAPLGLWPAFPQPGKPLRFSYASHLAVDGDDPAVFRALLRAVYNQAADRGDGYFMLGLSEANPFRSLLAGTYRHVAYASQLYFVFWDDGRDAVSSVDGRVPGPEIAVL